MRTIAASALACVALASGAAIAADGTDEILARSRAAYAALSSYSDIGVVESSETWDRPFTTAFVRPDKLRFEWTSRHPFVLLYFVKTVETVVSDGHRTVVRIDDDGRIVDREEPSLRLAVAAGTGVSARAIHHTATLLKSDLWADKPFGASVLAMRDARLVGTEAVDGVRCDHLAGTEARSSEKLDVWIGADEHLVRRIDTDFGEFKDSEFHRDIRINGPIASTTFALAQAPTR